MGTNDRLNKINGKRKVQRIGGELQKSNNPPTSARQEIRCQEEFVKTELVKGMEQWK